MAAPSCSSADVARLLLERVGSAGGDFTTGTTPTKAQVEALIVGIIQEVQTVAGTDIDSSLASFATLTVATGTAAQVELSFTNDLAKDATSKYQQLEEQYRGKPNINDPTKIGGRLGLLADAQAKIDQGGEPGLNDPPAAEAFLPDSTVPGFPQTTWATRW